MHKRMKKLASNSITSYNLLNKTKPSRRNIHEINAPQFLLFSLFSFSVKWQSITNYFIRQVGRKLKLFDERMNLSLSFS